MTQGFDEWLFNHNHESIPEFSESAFKAGAASRQAEIDDLKLSATEMSDYIDKAQSCLPYFLKNEKSDDNWIGGIQNKITDYETEIDELLERERKSNDLNNFEINHIANANQQLRLKVDELQNRINEALKELEMSDSFEQSDVMDEYLDRVFLILKGEKDE